MHPRFPGAHRHIRITGTAIQGQRVIRQEGIQVGPGEECRGQLSPGEIVTLGLPVVFQPDHVADAMSVAGLQPVQTSRGEISQQPIPPPGRVDSQVAAVMLAGRTDMVAPRSATADREDFVHLEGGITSRPGILLDQRVADRDRRGIDTLPVGHVTERPRQIDLLRPGVGQGPVGQGRHAPCQRRTEPPIAGGPRHVGHLTLQRRA